MLVEVAPCLRVHQKQPDFSADGLTAQWAEFATNSWEGRVAMHFLALWQTKEGLWEQMKHTPVVTIHDGAKNWLNPYCKYEG